MNILFALVSPLLAVLAGILFTTVLKLPTLSAKLVSIFAISFAEIVLIVEILGSTYALSNRALWLLLQVVFLLGIAVVWWRSGKPVPEFHFAWSRAQVLGSIRKYPVLWLLGIGVLLAYLIGAWLVLFVPPNNADGLSYRLTRVGYWLQFDSLFPWKTLNVRQTTFPPNAEFAVLWTILLRGTDQLAGFVQWLSALVSAIAIFGLGRLLGFSRTHSAFPALIYLTLSQVYLQSTSVQNDIVISAVYVSALYLLLLGITTRHRGALLISGICIGLSVGAKSTALFILPGLACAACLLLLQDIRGRFRLLVLWGGACLTCILVLGAYIYILNLMAFGNILGPEDFSERMGGSTDAVGKVYGLNIPFYQVSYSRLEMLVINAPRYFTQMLDFSSLGEVGQVLTRAKYAAFGSIFEDTIIAEAQATGTWDWLTSQTNLWGPHEDTAWFGLLGFVLFLPGIGYGVYLGVKRRDVVPLCIALLPVVFWILHSAAQPYTPAKGRYYVLPVTAGAVLMIWPMVSNGFFWRAGRLLLVCIAIITTANNILFNEHKPLIGAQSVLEAERTQRRGYNDDLDSYLGALETFIPPNASVALVGGESSIEYPIFGEYLTRYVIPIVLDSRRIDSLEDLRTQTPIFLIGHREALIPEQHVDYIVIHSGLFKNAGLDTDGFERITTGLESFIFRSFDTLETATDGFRYEFDGTTPGGGWYPPESGTDDVTYQWTGRDDVTVGAQRMSPADAYHVQIRVVSYLDEAIVNSLTLLANDDAIHLQRLPDNIFSGIIPSGVVESADGLLRLVLLTDRVVSPYELGLSADRRQMGVGVDWLTVEPLTIATSARAEFDGLYPTNGFFSPEFGDYNFQWTTAAVSDITIPVKVESDLRLRFLVRAELAPGSLENLSVAVNHQPVELTSEHTEVGILFTALVPQFPNDDHLVTISFQTIDPVPVNSLDVTNPDTRALGLALDWLTIEPS